METDWMQDRELNNLCETRRGLHICGELRAYTATGRVVPVYLVNQAADYIEALEMRLGR